VRTTILPVVVPASYSAWACRIVIELVYAVQRNDRVTGSDCVEKGLKYLRG